MGKNGKIDKLAQRKEMETVEFFLVSSILKE